MHLKFSAFPNKNLFDWHVDILTFETLIKAVAYNDSEHYVIANGIQYKDNKKQIAAQHASCNKEHSQLYNLSKKDTL